MNVRRAPAWAAAAVLLVGAGPKAFGGTADGLFDLLRPGSRPAIGIGGDPFRSRLDDETGWWRALGLSGPPVTRLEYGANDPVQDGGSQGSRVWDREMTALTTAGGRWAGSPWSVGVRGRAPQGTTSWEGTSGGLALDRSGNGGEIGMRLGIRPGITLQGTSPIWTLPPSQMNSGWGAGLRWQPGTRALIQASWEEARIPEQLRSDLHGELIAASLNLDVQNQRLEGRLGPLMGLAVEGAAARARFGEINPRTTTLTYQMEPEGASTTEEVTLDWRRTGSVRALGRWTHTEADIRGILSWGGQRFGVVDYGRLRMRSYLAAVEYVSRRSTRYLADVEWARAGARALGEVESWPFTSTLVDLLGPRRIYRLGATGAWSRWHAAVERPLGYAAGVRGGVEWSDVRPEADLESWQPAFLVFGRTNAHADRLRIRRFQLGALSLGGRVRMGRAEVDAGIDQFVFARVFKDAAGPAPSDVPAGAPPPARTSSHDRPHGTRFRVVVSRRF